MRRLEKWMDPRLEAGPSAIHGRGVLTRGAIAAGEVVMRWGGIVLPLRDYDPALHRPRSTTQWDETHCLTTPWQEPETLDELFNHSCDPNTWMLDAVTVVTRRDLAAGQELTTDIALWSGEDFLYAEHCRCGTSLCRGRITGADWSLPELGERYAGHFVPFLNARREALR